MGNISIGNKAFRKLAIQLLDDDNGIRKEAFETLSVMLAETDNEDILDAVDMTEDRAYIGEDFAEEELTKLLQEAKESMSHKEESGVTDAESDS